jgi:2-C-methyl-D-erythritol 2,4-cyclodiphosphate synthase
MIRIGLGRDFHRLVAGRRFLLGGMVLPADSGEDGHSDGDVLLHAVIDAVLGAAGLGDIGELFPPGDPAWNDADSKDLLRQAWDRVRHAGWHLVNLDCVVSCESPKLLPYREQIRLSLSGLLGVTPEAIFVKGKTHEGCDSIGAGMAVEALVVCLLEQN